MSTRQWILVLWPSFIAATVAESVFFAFFDPQDLAFLGERIRMSSTAVYSIGLFFFWAVAALSSAMTIYLAGESRPLRKQRAHS